MVRVCVGGEGLFIFTLYFCKMALTEFSLTSDRVIVSWQTAHGSTLKCIFPFSLRNMDYCNTEDL